MIATSLEARWFFPGTVPVEARSWLSSNYGIDVISHEERTDEYWRGTESCDLGIKLRSQTKLEIKGLLREFEAVVWTTSVGAAEARPQIWSKWAAPGLKLDRQAPVVTIAKSRSTVCLDLQTSEPAPVQRDSAGRLPRISRGLQIELCQLRFDDATFWSFGFEQFPGLADSSESLVRAAGPVLKDFPLELPLSASLSYPALILRQPSPTD